MATASSGKEDNITIAGQRPRVRLEPSANCPWCLHLYPRARVRTAACVRRYSTRELVNIVRHLSAFPEDSMDKTLQNVLSFDSFDERLLERLTQTFETHGLLLSLIHI